MMNIFFSYVFAVVVLLGFFIVNHSASMPVKHVRIASSFVHVNQRVLEKALSPYVQDHFLLIRLSQLKNTLFKHPWVESMVIKKIWPDTLEVQLEESKPLARWGAQGLLSTKGRIFYPWDGSRGSMSFGDYPLILGEDSEILGIVDLYKQAQVECRGLGLEIKVFDARDPHDYRLTLSNEQVLLLSKDSFIEQIHRFIKVYPQLFLNQRAQSTDLRYPNGFSVLWAQ